ncbi:MAG TPA: DUF2007 domain-containing protein [Bacteroidales bacterium]|nr:DUF2007 domain-containing protein [Bacteroidales bacterium]
MDNWIVVISFIYPHEAHMAKGKLESEGIEVLIRDELTAQVNNFYSNAIGGVKLLVKEPDFDTARQLLVEAGYIKEQEVVPNKFWGRFDRITAKLPFIGRLVTEMRLIIVVAVLLMAIAFPIVLLSLPTFADRLTGNTWCVFQINYNGQELIPKEQIITLRSSNVNCSGTMRFDKDGTVYFPGMNAYIEKAHWELRSDGLVITPITDGNSYTIDEHLKITPEGDTLTPSVYAGVYQVEIRKNLIKMQSDSLVIWGEVY